MKILSWLNKPYPFIADLKSKFLISFLFGIFVYLFLLIFQPFGIDKIIANKSIYLVGFGLVTTIVLLLNYTILPLVFPEYFDLDKWKIKKEISFIILSITLITFLNYQYNTIVGYPFAQQHGLQYFIPVTVSVGFFPVTLLVFITELFLNRKHQKAASEISSKIHKERETGEPASNRIIKILSESKKDNFEINEKDLIFIKSDDNYCKVYYQENNEIKNQLLRISLKNIENQLAHIPEIIRCHRSYIVNKKQILKISGNARAYYLHLYMCEEKVPISRSFPKEQLL